MGQTKEVSIHRRKHTSFGLKDSSFEKKEEAKKVELQLQKTVKLRAKSDHNEDSFIISKRKRDPQMEEGSVGNEVKDFGISHTWLFESDHNQQRINGIMGVIVPKKARSSNNSVRKLMSKPSSSPNEEHNETEIAEVLYGIKSSSRNQDSSEKLQKNGDLALKSSTVGIEREKLDDEDDIKSCVPNKYIKKVNLESIDLMAPPATDLELGNHNFKIDLEVPNKDTDILANQQVNKTVSPAWSRIPPPPGFPIVQTDKTIGSSSTALQLADFSLSPPQPKHCACHYYIARNIFQHQQLLRDNSRSSCGTKASNVVNEVPTPEESKIIEQQSQNDVTGLKMNVTQVKEKELVASNKSPAASNSADSMQIEQQDSCIMHQPSPPIVGNSFCASSSNNSSPVLRDAAENSSISIGLSLSHKQSNGFQVNANKLMTETFKEKSPPIIGQNLTIPIQPKNENFGDKKQEAKLNGGFELVSSQSFAISFHSQPSVAWQGYYSSWTTAQEIEKKAQCTKLPPGRIQEGMDEVKVNSWKSSSSTIEPTAFVFDDSSKYLSFVLSPKNRTCLDHSMASSSQHLLHKASNSTTSETEPVRKSSRRPLEQGRVFQGHEQISFGKNYKSFPTLQVQR